MFSLVRHSRNQSVVRPVADGHDGSFMASPDRDGSFGREAPDHHPSVAVTGGKERVLEVELQGVNRGFVAS